MAKKAEQVKQDFLQQMQQEATQMLSAAVATPNKQLCLFEEWADWTDQHKASKTQNTDGLTIQQEIFARLWAAGWTKTEAYRAAYPNCKTENVNTVYPKASRLSKLGKVRARKEAFQKQLADTALMSPTEVFQRLTQIARDGGKDSLDALKQIAQIHGLFKQENNPANTQVIVQRIDFANAYAPKEQAADGQNGEVDK